MSNDVGGRTPIPAFNMRRYWQALALIALIVLLPMATVYLAATIADLNGCTILDAGPTPCVILGADRGEILYNMAAMVQVSFITLPIGIALGFIWPCVLVISVMTWRRKRSGVADATKLEINFGYYGLSLLAILAIGYATLEGWLPAPVLLLVSFVAIFWIFSFVFALLTTLRDRGSAK